ncbi:MAG TPA: NADH-ubiquinone oxidoreductase-F iron-sulfur binding region domain-containing protein [Acidimicrobiia bacterium]|nr:NADH-ubiquinone oxidoreductase-F iron-sulfur binding region domain-containing protein [Acidimicrobiia bacterium]
MTTPPCADTFAGSFFHLDGLEITDQACQGTACFAARHRDPERWASAVRSEPRVSCLGKCHVAPAVATDETPCVVAVDVADPVVLGRVARGRPAAIDAYLADGGYTGLERALSLGAERAVSEIEASQLRGRGGAAYPTGRKWRAALDHHADAAYVVANGDEGDPGAYVDRVLLEEDPHAVLEGLAVAAVTVGAQHAFVYIRKEYPRARRCVECALAEARAAGVLGPAVLGSGPPLDVTVVEGEGSYVCGEETALLNALEGRRPDVRARPPYPTEHGLFGRPTVVDNVETLAAVPWILRRGGAAHAALGAGASRGTKAVSLNSLFRRPGVYEVELGVTVRHVVEDLGGGPADGDVTGVLIGGPLAGVLPPRLLDTPLGFQELRAVGCEVGHGGIVAFDGHTSMLELAHHVFRFGAYESCGKCTPCRVGAARIEDLLDGSRAERCGPSAAREWRGIVAALAATSLCGHGTGLGAFARSLETHYGKELGRWLG